MRLLRPTSSVMRSTSRRLAPSHCIVWLLLLALCCSLSSSSRTDDSNRDSSPNRRISQKWSLELNPTFEHDIAMLRDTEWHQDLPRSASDVRRRLNGNDANTVECVSPLQKWYASVIDDIGWDTYRYMEDNNITAMAYLYKHYVLAESGAEEYLGVNGEETDALNDRHQHTVGFWNDADSTGSLSIDNVLLLGMHGADLQYDSKLVPTLQQMYGISIPQALELAHEIQDLIRTLPDTFDNPILTANAVAIKSAAFRGEVFPDSVTIGDGIFHFLQSLGLGEDGPDYIHAHELGHHLQFDLGVTQEMGDGWTPSEEARRFELMADALGAYYLAHGRGGSMDASRILDVHRAAFSLGDCDAATNGHHGTPAQRECASLWGAYMASSTATSPGTIMDPDALWRQFDATLSGIVSLRICQPVAVPTPVPTKRPTMPSSSSPSLDAQTVVWNSSPDATPSAADGGGGGSNNNGGGEYDWNNWNGAGRIRSNLCIVFVAFSAAVVLFSV